MCIEADMIKVLAHLKLEIAFHNYFTLQWFELSIGDGESIQIDKKKRRKQLANCFEQSPPLSDFNVNASTAQVTDNLSIGATFK